MNVVQFGCLKTQCKNFKTFLIFKNNLRAYWALVITKFGKQPRSQPKEFWDNSFHFVRWKKTMDIFHIETASLGTARTNSAIIDDVTNDRIPQVSFDGGPEFNLSFFDSPDDSNTGYCSDPGSVDSTIGVSISPSPQPLTNTISSSSSLSSTPQPIFTTPVNFPCNIGMFSSN